MRLEFIASLRERERALKFRRGSIVEVLTRSMQGTRRAGHSRCSVKLIRGEISGRRILVREDDYDARKRKTKFWEAGKRFPFIRLGFLHNHHGS